jgi:hypothetical protein
MKPLTSNERAMLNLRPTPATQARINITQRSIDARNDPEKLAHLLELIAGGIRSEA